MRAGALGGAMVVMGCGAAPPPRPVSEFDLLFWDEGKEEPEQRPVLDIIAVADTDFDGRPELSLRGIHAGALYFTESRGHGLLRLDLEGGARLMDEVDAFGEPTVTASLPGALSTVRASDPALRLSRRGGSPTVVVTAPGGPSIDRIELVDSGFSYWRSGDDLMRQPAAGGPAIPVARARDTMRSDYTFSSDGRSLYRASHEALFRAPLSGGAWQEVAALPPADRSWTIHPIAGKLYALSSRMLLRLDPEAPRARRLVALDDVPIGSIAVLGLDLYYTTRQESGDVLWAMPKRGGASTPALKLEQLGAAPALEEAHAYFLTVDGRLVRAGLTGGSREMLVMSDDVARALSAPEPYGYGPSASREDLWGSAALPELVAVDATSVYWVDRAQRAALKLPKRGGPIEVLMRGLENPDKLAIDDLYVYLSDDGPSGTRLLRVDKMGGRPEVLARVRVPAFHFSASGDALLWAADDDLFSLSREDGFRALPRLGSLLDRSLSHNFNCSFAARGADLFYSRCEDDWSSSQVVSRSGEKRALRILGARHRHPARLAVDADTVYILEVGTKAGPRSRGSGRERFHCCSIWAAPR
ncbi:hypothetical protein WME79_30995 [Sorangium sp. So ce726]|uniref:hypothetical protein n=1 Tax=Sorangium sp. So ce726 TaxID=3133319 RepID=UPI003F61685C